jgi:hypothetical protein
MDYFSHLINNRFLKLVISIIPYINFLYFQSMILSNSGYSKFNYFFNFKKNVTL